jgi:hypothetical protein
VGPIPGVKRQEREAKHSLPSSAEVNNGGPIPPLHIYLHGILLNYTTIKYRDNFILPSRYLLTKKWNYIPLNNKRYVK